MIRRPTDSPIIPSPVPLRLLGGLAALIFRRSIVLWLRFKIMWIRAGRKHRARRDWPVVEYPSGPGARAVLTPLTLLTYRVPVGFHPDYQ